MKFYETNVRNYSSNVLQANDDADARSHSIFSEAFSTETVVNLLAYEYEINSR